MRVLVVGGGGREHALCWKISRSSLVSRVFCAPGNAGIRSVADCVPVAATDIAGLLRFALAEKIDLTVAGPEAPLAAGITNAFVAEGLRVFGPTKEAAQIESSKQFAKQLMQASGIPTARFTVCTTLSEAIEAVKSAFDSPSASGRLVIKADGLAAGKGVVVAENEEEATRAVERMMSLRAFGRAGDTVVIEECLFGEEASIMVISDGERYVALAPSQDHKRALDGDRGPNTGGMGAYTPVPSLSPEMLKQALDRIVQPAITELSRQGTPFRGALYAGIMMTQSGVQTVEFNARMGDPETEAILPLLESDIVPYLSGAAEGCLPAEPLRWKSGAAVCVVATAPGYPGEYPTGSEITDDGSADGHAHVFHCGTKMSGDQLVTNGGRVLAVTGTGSEILQAAERAYTRLGAIHFDGMHYRKDIAARAMGN